MFDKIEEKKFPPTYKYLAIRCMKFEVRISQ